MLGEQDQPIVDGEITEVLLVEREQRETVADAAGGHPGVVLRPRAAPPWAPADNRAQLRAISAS